MIVDKYIMLTRWALKNNLVKQQEYIMKSLVCENCKFIKESEKKYIVDVNELFLVIAKRKNILPSFSTDDVLRTILELSKDAYVFWR